MATPGWFINSVVASMEGLSLIHIFLPKGDDTVRIVTRVRCTYKTGVEIEALTAASVAALTVYDMCKAVDRGMCIQNVCLLEKKGGKSGHFKREEGERAGTSSAFPSARTSSSPGVRWTAACSGPITASRATGLPDRGKRCV